MEIEVARYTGGYLSRNTVTEDEFLVLTPFQLRTVKCVSDDKSVEILWECHGDKKYEEYRLWSVRIQVSGERDRTIIVTPAIGNDGKIVSRYKVERNVVVRGGGGNDYIVKYNREDVVRFSKAMLDALSPALLMVRLSDGTETVQNVIFEIINSLLKWPGPNNGPSQEK